MTAMTTQDPRIVRLQVNTSGAWRNVMDGLIDMDRHGIAERAAYWSIEVLRRIRLNVYRGMKHD